MGHTLRRAALRASASVAAAVMLASCHGEPIGPQTQTTVTAGSVLILPAADTLRVGAARQLVARVLDVDGHEIARQVSWRSLAPAVLSLTTGGGAVGLAAGSAQVIATSDAVADTATVVVMPVPVRQVIVTPSPALVQVGSGVQLQVETRDSSGTVLTGRAVSFQSQNTGIATVSATGVVTGVAAGSTTVVVSSESASTNVTVTVDAPAIALSATTASFTAKATLGNPAPQTIAVTNSGAYTLSGLSASVTYGGAGGWLAAGLSSTSAPATLTLQPVTGGLPPGVYTATVTVASSLAGVQSRTVAVTFTVTAQPVVLLSPSSVQFTAQSSGALPAAQGVNVTNAGSGTLGGLAFTTLYGAGGSGWLAASLTATTAPTTLNLQPNSTVLAVGTYSARVIVNSATDATVPPDTVLVSYVVGQGPIIGLSRTTVSSTAGAGQAKPDTQTVAISNAGSGTLSGLSASVAYGSGSGWLTASVNPTTAPATLTLAANASALAAGTYTATVTIASTVAGVQSQAVTVTFTVTSAPRIALSIRTRSFSATRGGTTPAAQTVSVTNGGSGTLAGLAVSTVYTSGSGWLNAGLSSTTAPATLTVQPNTTALAAGSYGARVIVTSTIAGVAPDTVTVSYTVQQAQIGLSTATVSLGSLTTGTNAPNGSVNVTNAGQGTLSGLAVTDDASWITPSLAATTAPTTLTLAYATSGLAAGSYTGHVIVSSSLPGVTPDTVTVTVTVAASTGGGGSSLTADPAQLAIAARQSPQWQSYTGRTLAAGGSYVDPVTGVRVWKLTSSSVPVANGGMMHMYSGGPAQISRRLSTGIHTALFYVQANGDFYLADITPGSGVSNYRALTGLNDAYLAATFSLRTDSPEILYYFNGSSLVRWNTRTNSAAPSGLFPKNFTALGGQSGHWLQQDKDDRWFVFMNPGATTIYAWDSQTDQLLTWAPGSLDEPHFDRDGRFVASLDNANVSQVRMWDLTTGTKSTNLARVVHPAFMRSYFVSVDPYDDVEYYINGASAPVNTLQPDQHSDGVMHRGDQWIQTDAMTGGNLLNQWYLYSAYADGETNLGGWTLSSGNVYWTTVGFDWNEAGVGVQEVDQTSGSTSVQTLRKATSVANMTEGSFFWDGAANRLYVWAQGGGSPGTRVNAFANSNIHDGIAFVRVNGSEMRLAAHTYSRGTTYETQPHATISPDGLMVMWTTDMGVAGGRGDVFVAEMPNH